MTTVSPPRRGDSSSTSSSSMATLIVFLSCPRAACLLPVSVRRSETDAGELRVIFSSLLPAMSLAIPKYTTRTVKGDKAQPPMVLIGLTLLKVAF